jgi:hypothetical protein
MRLYVCWDGDHIGREVGRAVMTDDVVAVRRVDQAITAGNELWRSFALRSNGMVIEMGGDEGRIELGAEHLPDLPAVAEQYAQAVGATVSVGIGMKLSESAKALLVAKLRGGNQTVLWHPDMQPELAAAAPKTEAEKIGDEYLGKAQRFSAAAFRHKRTGQVTATGRFHDPDQLPQPEALGDYDQGFVDEAGRFYTREEATQALRMRRPIQSEQIFKAGEGSIGLEGQTSPSESLVSPLQAGPVDAVQNSPPPQETDFENLLHAEAEKQAAQDSTQDEHDAAAMEQLRNQLVEILSLVRTKSPIIAQLKQADAEAYQAVMALVQGVITLGRELLGTTPSEASVTPRLVQHEMGASPATREGELDKSGGPIAGLPAQVHLNLPPGSVVNSKVRVRHFDGSESWVDVRSGMVQSQDPAIHPVSTREPGAR